MAQVVAWIQAGAPEKSGVAAPPPTTTATEGWTGGIDQLVNAKCATCHVNASMGDLSLKTYTDALKGGKDGPAIVPNDPIRACWCRFNKRAAIPVNSRRKRSIA